MRLIKKIFKQFKFLFYLVFFKQRRFRKRLFYRIKINKLTKSKAELRNKKTRDKDYLKESKTFLQNNFNGYSNIKWHHLYSSINHIKKVEYIPEELFFVFIEPALNNKLLKAAYTDKTAYDHFFDKSFLPETICKIIKGTFLDENYEIVNTTEAFEKIRKINGKVVLKPAILGGGGKNVIIDSPKNIISHLSENSDYKNNSFILQQYLEQHKILEQFHPESLNTLRILTARVNNTIVILSMYLRMGQNKSFIDNGVAGGIACGFSENGKLNKTAYDKFLNEYEKHPNTGVIFNNTEIPGFNDACDFCTSNHKIFPHFTFISWDIGINKYSKPIFIEFNLSTQEIGTHQLINGPLFGEHTMYFVNKFNNEKKVSAMLRFNP